MRAAQKGSGLNVARPSRKPRSIAYRAKYLVPRSKLSNRGRHNYGHRFRCAILGRLGMLGWLTMIDWLIDWLGEGGFVWGVTPGGWGVGERGGRVGLAATNVTEMARADV